jgi:4-amino-4-deoxy-L-arabinose transferase-like glycosyltransferase
LIGLSDPVDTPRPALPRWVLLIVGALTLVGLILRARSLGNSLFGDELSSYFIVTDHSVGRILHILYGHSVDLNPPLYFLSAWVVERFGASAQALRVVPLVAGTLAIPFTFALGRRTLGWRAGLVGAALAALSPNLIFFSTEARPYALTMALLLASTLALLRALESRRVVWWAAYAVLSCAAAYTHYVAVFVLIAQLGWAWWACPPARRALVGSNALAVLGFLPWIPAMVRDSHSPGTKVLGFVDPFGVHDVASDLAHWSVGHPFLGLTEVPGRLALAMVAAGALIGLAALLTRGQVEARGAGGAHAYAAREHRHAGLVLVLVLALSLPVGLALYSLFRDSVWDERNLVASWPGFGLLLGALTLCAEGWGRAVAVGLVVAGFAIGAFKLLTPAHQRPDYRAAVKSVPVGAEIVDLPGPTPGPLSEVDAALADGGDWRRQTRPVLRIGPPRSRLLHAAPYAALPEPTPAALARRAARAAYGGKLFAIAYGAAPLSALEPGGVLEARQAFGAEFGTGATGYLLAIEFGRLQAFARALEPRFVPQRARTFPGFLPVTLYTFAER